MHLSSIFFILLALVAGMAIPVQAAINGQLARVLGNTFAAATISFASGAVLLVALTALTMREMPQQDTLKAAPWSIFVLGGVLGLLFVSTNAFLVPRIGAAITITFVIAGQLVSALLIDQFGVFGVVARETSLGRVFGLVLVLIGALMVRLL